MGYLKAKMAMHKKNPKMAHDLAISSENKFDLHVLSRSSDSETRRRVAYNRHTALFSLRRLKDDPVKVVSDTARHRLEQRRERHVHKD